MQSKLMYRYGQIIEDARGVLLLLERGQISHTKLETNYAAHGSAKAAIKQVMNCVLFE
jgi:hypothetical protein